MKIVKLLDGTVNRVKDSKSPIKESVLENLIGRLVYASTNELTDSDGTKHNVWFAGLVAGYQKSTVGFDFVTQSRTDGTIVQLHVIMADGMAYTLSSSELEIEELTEAAFMEMAADFTAKQIASETILLPEEKNKNLLLPGRDF